MVRLQRVTFLALHNYLGLTTELFNPVGGTLILVCVCMHRKAHIHTQSHTASLFHTTLCQNCSVIKLTDNE